jgi:TPR repeat protein
MINFCMALSYSDNDYRKYGFIKQKDILIEKSIWGYRLRYAREKANSYAYVMAKIPEIRSSYPERGKISFRFKARLYPVAPNTDNMRRVIKAYVKASLGKTKEHKRKRGIISTPSFVVSTKESMHKKSEHSSFPLQYSKLSDEMPEPNEKGKKVILIFRDARLLPINFFSNYDVEVTFDYLNRIVSFNSNGNKVILRDMSLKIWKYYGFATLFSPLGVNKNTIIALQYEFSDIKIGRNVMSIKSEEKQFSPPRFDCDFYEDLIDRKKYIDAMYLLGMNYYEGLGGAEKDYYQAFKYFKKAAMKEHVFAQYYLGLCYLYGRGIEKNDLLAWKWLFRSSKYFYDKAQVAAAQCVIDNVKITTELSKAKLLQSMLGPAFFQGNANACFLQSYCAEYDITKTEVDYIDGFKDAARRGHPKAFYYLGMNFAKKKRTMKTAFKCYSESAQLGFVPAFVKVGNCYQTASGTGKNLKEAFKWFKKAADKKNTEGIFKLACCYLLGQGVGKDKKQALRLFLRAAKKSSPHALIALLLLRENNLQSSFFTGNDKAADDKFKAAKKSTYLSRRAICLKYGIGMPESTKKAIILLQSRSTNNYWMAFELADSYENSKTKSRDFYRAINLYKKAAVKGDVRALYRLGRLYFKLGDKKEAMLYYRQAAKKGNAEAAFVLAGILRKEAGKNNFNEQSKAFMFFEKAAKNGHVRAYYELGDCYYKGQGVEKDVSRAAECWKKYETAFLEQQNNSIHGLYWKDLPYQRPIKYDKNGLPLKFHSQLKNKDQILNYYKKY